MLDSLLLGLPLSLPKLLSSAGSSVVPLFHSACDDGEHDIVFSLFWVSSTLSVMLAAIPSFSAQVEGVSVRLGTVSVSLPPADGITWVEVRLVVSSLLWLVWCTVGSPIHQKMISSESRQCQARVSLGPLPRLRAHCGKGLKTGREDTCVSRGFSYRKPHPGP